MKKLADKSLSTEDRATLLYKFGVVRQLVPKSNVAVYTPSDSNLHFTLPQKMTEHAGDEVQVVIVTIPFDASKLDDGKFLFNNTVWDEIENTVEHGAVQAGEIVTVAQATHWLLSFTKEDENVIFTMMTPSDWSYMLDPGESPDVNDALKAIRDSIVSAIKIPEQDPSGEQT